MVNARQFLKVYEDDFEEIGYFISKMAQAYPNGMKKFDKILYRHTMWDVVDAAYAYYSLEVLKEDCSPRDKNIMRSIIDIIKSYD